MSAPDTRLAEVLRLALVEGQSVRAISRGLSMSRRTVRRLLGRAADSRRRALRRIAFRCSIASSRSSSGFSPTRRR